MADYISSYSGTEIDGAVGKAKGITKTAPEINTLLEHTETNKDNLANMENGTVPVKGADGTLAESGIVDNGKNIFFPKTGRFPSGSIDIGPAITLSENGGWVQNTSQTLGKSYLMLDYLVDKTGTTKPVYWERKAEETGVIIQSDSTKNMNINTFDHIPTTDSQVNKLYFDLTDAVQDLVIEITSLDTNEPIKYLPNEKAWQDAQKGKPYQGLDLNSGLVDVLGDTPFSALKAYHLRFTFNKFINIKGSGAKPYIKVDRQLIVAKNVLVDGDGSGGTGVNEFTELIDAPDSYAGKGGKFVAVKSGADGLEFVDSPDGAGESATDIRNKLQTLTADERLDASAIKNIPVSPGVTEFTSLTDTPSDYTGMSGKVIAVKSSEDGVEYVDNGSETGQEIAAKLTGLSGDDRLGIEALKNVEDTISPNYMKVKLEELTGTDRLDASAIKNLPSGGVATFTSLTDTPVSYSGQANKILSINSGENAIEFVDAPSGSTDADTIQFRHSFGVKAMNKTGQTINANTFVFLSPKPNGKYNMAPITKTTKYKGELFGLLETQTVADAEATVNLIDNIQTGTTGVSEGVAAYIGFADALPGSDLISISTKDNIEQIFGRCGVFGIANDIGEYMATFDCFQVQANYLIDEHTDTVMAYYNNLPAVIDKEALFVYLVDDLVSAGGTVVQQLPQLNDVVKGMQIIIENQSSSPLNKIQLTAVGSDTIEGARTYDVTGGNHKIILVAAENKWMKLFDSSVNGGGDVTQQVATNTAGISDNKKEIDRLKTDISTSGLPTYVFRDKGVPVLPATSTTKYKAYYIHTIVLPDNLQSINIPSGTDDGTILSFENNDRSKQATVRPPSGETINGANSYQASHDTLNFFVKDGTDWKLAFGGVFPNSLTALKSTIQSLLPNSLNTMDEIEAQLKDRLHTFREIQNEFASQLHTLDAIEADMTNRGFTKDGGRMGVQGDQAVPTDIASWSVKDFASNEEFLLPAQNKGNQYIVFSLPTQTASLVGEVMINQQTMGFTSHDLIDNELDYKVFISKDPVDTTTTVRFKINYIHGTDVMIEWGLSDTQSVNLGSTDWIYGQMQANQHIIPPIQSQLKYVVFKVPVELFPVIDGVYVGSKLEETTNTAVVADGTYNYRVMVTNDKVDLSTLTKVNINYDYSGNGGTSGIEIDDGTTDKTGINKINISGAYLSKVYDDSDEVDLKCVTSWETLDGNGGGNVNRVLTEAPLLSYLDPDTKPGEEDRVKLYVQHDYFELAKPPGYLAYLSENELVMGRVKQGETGTRTAPIWFDDNVVGGNSEFIQIDKPNKALGIQDYTGDDPNVTGGVPTLLAFRVAMKGKAPNDGFVEILLKKTDEGTPTQDGDFLLNANGNPIGIRRKYKSGDDLGILDCMAIYMAKGITKFQCILEHNFVDDGVFLEDRTEGASGVLIQALGKDYATGDALLQFENDTMQNIEMSKHYNGEDIFNMAWALTYDRADVDITTGTGQTSVDGLHFYNNTNLKVGVADKTIHIHDNGTDMAYFNLGQIFSAEKTYMLRDRDLDVKVTLQDKRSAYRIYMVKWIGKPDQYTTKIFTGSSNINPVLDTNWELGGSVFISEDELSGEHDFAGTLTVPSDAVNFAVVIAPQSMQAPIDLYMKGFEIDVSDPFYGWILEAPELVGEKHLQFDERHAELRCDVAGYASIRYTLNDVPVGMPMPIGVIKSGKADIEIDHTINQVSGTALPQFEGAIKFNKEGKALIQTDLYVHSEKAHSVLATTKFWYSKVSQDGNTFTKIPLSEYSTQVRGQTKAINKMPKFEVDVQPGDRIALFGTTDQADGAFIDQNLGDPTPMLKTIIDFDEITEAESDLLDRLVDLEKHADEILFVENDVPVADPENYRLKIDVKTAQIEVEKINP